MTRKELEEIMRKGEDVWCYYIAEHDIGKLNDEYDLKKYKIEVVAGDENLILGDYEFYYPLKYLFSSEAQAQHYLKNGNVLRTEKLPYITWEEFRKNKNLFCRDSDKNLIEMYINEDLNQIIIEKDSLEWFKFEATEENFYKAYEVCRKLFLGEEI